MRVETELIAADGMTVGIALRASGSGELYIYTLGDELYASVELPAKSRRFKPSEEMRLPWASVFSLE